MGYFNRDISYLDEHHKEDLRTLEREGCTYGQFWWEEFDEFRYCRIPFEPIEIVQYVEVLTAYNEYLGYRAEGFDETEALDRITDEKIQNRVREYNEWARNQERAHPFVPAAFYPSELELLLTGNKKDRYEFVDETHTGDKRFLLRDIIENLELSVIALQDRDDDRPDFEITRERDIHDLLYSIIKPIFPEARTEESTTKQAGSSKRIDIVIPEISTGIELKYVRNSSHAGEVGDELRVDFESYHVHEDCTNLIAVVWDPESLISDPHNFENDLAGPREIDGDRMEVEVHVF